MSKHDDMFMVTALTGISMLISFLLVIVGCWFWWQLLFQWIWPLAPLWLARPSLIKFGSACILSITFVILFLNRRRRP